MRRLPHCKPQSLTRTKSYVTKNESNCQPHAKTKGTLLGLLLAFTLPACAGTPKTRTILIKPPTCVVSAWPELPEVYLLEGCPEGMVCISPGDRLAIVFREDDLDRLHHQLEACPNVKFEDSPTDSPAPIPAVSPVSP